VGPPAAGITRADPVATTTEHLLLQLRDDDVLRVPLSATHYLKTWHRTETV
jgi:hypothetical protein